MYLPKHTSVERSFELGKQLGIETRNTSELLMYLREVNITKFPAALAKLIQYAVSCLLFVLIIFTPILSLVY